MAGKSDPEALKKNLFWILLGGFGVLWLVMLALVMMTGDDTKKKAFDEAKKKIASASGVKTDAFIEPWNKYNEKVSGYKKVIWKEAYDQQKHIFTWPQGMKIAQSPDFRPATELTSGIRGAFRDQYKAQPQEDQLESLVAPAIFTGGFSSVFPLQKWDREKAPSREEIWLAQEEYWVRREMVRALQAAQNSVAVCEESWWTWLDRDTRRVFRNANWEIELRFEKKGGRLVISSESTIRNINRTKKTQSLASSTSQKGVPFRLYQGQGASYIMRIAGEPQPYGSSTKFNRSYDVDPVNLSKPFVLQQVLEWETSPLRAVEALKVPYHSHRTITWGYVINEDLKKLDPEEQSEDAPAPPAGDGPGGGMTMPGPGGGPGMGVGAAPDGNSTTLNRINRLRYMTRTPECRHLPIALRVVVDQAHIHDVLAALSNSPLRTQITQVTMVSAGAPGKTSGPGAGGPGTGPGGPGMPGSGMGPGSYRPPPPPAFGGRFGRGGGREAMEDERGDDVYGAMPGADGGKEPPKGAATVLDDAQLVELTVYAVATLYDKPPAEGKPEGAGQ